MRSSRLVFIILLTLVFSGCAIPEEEVATLVPTAVSQNDPTTNTPQPATATSVPEPATATSAPTSTDEPVPTDTAVPENTAVSTSTGEPTAIDTQTATEPPIAATNTAASTAPPTTASATTAPATTQPAPPPAVGGGSVTAPNDNNYPSNDDRVGWENRIRVPAGFSVSYVGRVEGSPTSITFGPDGLLYIAVQQGNIFAMNETGNSTIYASGFNTPTGIAFRPGTSTLYVASRLRNENVGGEAQISIANGGQVVGGLPCCYTFFHSANGIAFGADGMGYVGVGARADHGEILGGENAGQQDERHPLEATILRFNPDSGAVDVYARGLRNAYDVAWDANGQLWASENQPDFDPPEEVHRVEPGGEHGYPWYDCDVCFSPPDNVTIVPPVYTFAPSSSPTGITAYTASQFPSDYYNNKFVTLWSSFFGAQKVMRLGSGAPTNFATGFAAPIDVTVGPDGSLYVADWATGIIFKISYSG